MPILSHKLACAVGRRSIKGAATERPVKDALRNPTTTHQVGVTAEAYHFRDRLPGEALCLSLGDYHLAEHNLKIKNENSFNFEVPH